MAAALCIALVAAIISSRQIIRSPARFQRASLVLLLLSAILSGVYMVFLILSISLFDDRTLMDYRILSPLYVTGLIGNLVGLQWLSSRAASLWTMRVSLWVFCMALVCGYAFDSLAWRGIASEYGLGFAQKRFYDPELQRALSTLPQQNTTLYSNLPSPVLASYFHGDLHPLPSHRPPQPGEPPLADSIRFLNSRIGRGRAFVLFFGEGLRKYEISRAELLKLIRLSVRAEGQGWVLYGPPDR
jgi:hypothetical protein